MRRSHSLSVIRCKEFDENGACKYGDKCKFSHRDRRGGMGPPTVTLICRKCDRNAASDAKFCAQCGSGLSNVSAAAPSSPTFTEMDAVAQGFAGGSAYDTQEFNNNGSGINSTLAGPSEDCAGHDNVYDGPAGVYADSLDSSAFGHLGSSAGVGSMGQGVFSSAFDRPGTAPEAGYFDLSNSSASTGGSTSKRRFLVVSWCFVILGFFLMS